MPAGVGEKWCLTGQLELRQIISTDLIVESVLAGMIALNHLFFGGGDFGKSFLVICGSV